MEDWDSEPGDWVPEADRPGERLLSLTLVLLSNPNGLTKEEIFASIRGYRDAQAKNANPQALEKLFTRDKDSLREIGIQLDTFIAKHDLDDNTKTRYRINSSEFIWPKNTKLNANQVRLLELATKVWARASLSSDAQRAVTRLRALGLPSEGLDLSGFAPRILTNEPSFLVLEEAVREGREVTFDYRAPNADITKRHVQPLQLRNISGQWLLIAWDVDQDDFRNFLLKRITSRIKVLDATFAPATNEHIREAEGRLNDFIESNVATIRVQKDTEAWVHFDLDAPGSSPEGLVTFNFMDLHLLADELRQYGRSVEVLQPEALREAIRRGLEKVVNQHA